MVANEQEPDSDAAENKSEKAPKAYESKIEKFRQAILEDLNKFQQQKSENNPVDNLLKRLENQKDSLSQDEYEEAQNLILDINQIQSRNAKHIDRVWELLQGHEENT